MDNQGKYRKPHFQAIKDYVSDKIASGAFRPGDRIPSENDLVAEFSVSRMTVNRALKELESEGAISRVQGVGSFVSIPRCESASLEIRDIAEEITEAGQTYACEPMLVEANDDDNINDKLGLPSRSEHFRAILLHLADGVPVQLEKRWVNPAFSADFLEVDFTTTTSHRHLMSLGPLQAAEYAFDATLPGSDVADWLMIERNHVCTELRRRTWSLNIVASYAIFIAPRSRRQLRGKFGNLPRHSTSLPVV